MANTFVPYQMVGSQPGNLNTLVPLELIAPQASLNTLVPNQLVLTTGTIKSQLRFLGANQSTVFTDERPSPTPRIWTRGGVGTLPKIVTDATAAAGVSGQFFGPQASNQSYISTPYTADMVIDGSSAIYCHELFFFATSGGSILKMCGRYNSNIASRTFSIAHDTISAQQKIRLIVVPNAGSVQFVHAGVFTLNTWNHVAFYRFQTGTSRGFFLALNGVVNEFSVGNYLTTQGAATGGEPLAIGGGSDSTGGTNWIGRIQGYRFYNGFSPYGASNFTAPSPPFPAAN